VPSRGQRIADVAKASRGLLGEVEVGPRKPIRKRGTRLPQLVAKVLIEDRYHSATGELDRAAAAPGILAARLERA